MYYMKSVQHHALSVCPKGSPGAPFGFRTVTQELLPRVLELMDAAKFMVSGNGMWRHMETVELRAALFYGAPFLWRK